MYILFPTGRKLFEFCTNILGWSPLNFSMLVEKDCVFTHHDSVQVVCRVWGFLLWAGKKRNEVERPGERNISPQFHLILPLITKPAEVIKIALILGVICDYWFAASNNHNNHTLRLSSISQVFRHNSIHNSCWCIKNAWLHTVHRQTLWLNRNKDSNYSYFIHY